MKDLFVTLVLLWPVLLYIAAALAVVTGMLGLSHFLGERRKDHTQSEPYESGIESTGSARLRFPVKFYVIAMFFVLFDIESIFVITWAISFRELGWAGYTGILVFTGILFVVLLYEWRTGALNFGPEGRKILKNYHQQKNKKVTETNL
ncbi:MAG TPA: NADH-quinone oxidoreductase subunit A [Sunxiuqinia sp.]|nr:NADH-quinone oxidoreductase subunit A [Sunxiuqinia sp.]